MKLSKPPFTLVDGSLSPIYLGSSALALNILGTHMRFATAHNFFSETFFDYFPHYQKFRRSVLIKAVIVNETGQINQYLRKCLHCTQFVRK